LERGFGQERQLLEYGLGNEVFDPESGVAEPVSIMRRVPRMAGKLLQPLGPKLREALR
jgi:hypothetical protein